MKFLLDKEQLKTFSEMMKYPAYNRIKFKVEEHKDNGTGQWIDDSYWVKFETTDELDANIVLQACFHAGLNHNFNKYFKNPDPCY